MQQAGRAQLSTNQKTEQQVHQQQEQLILKLYRAAHKHIGLMFSDVPAVAELGVDSAP